MTNQDASGSPRPRLPERVQCEVCQRELPADEALVGESEGYVRWFCGTRCYEKWQHAAVPKDTT